MPDDKDLQLSKGLENEAKTIEKGHRPEIRVEQPDISAEKEKGAEAQVERESISREEKPAVKDESEPGGMAALSNLAQKRKQRETEIEKVLAQDLDDIYLHLAPDKQQELKKAGEETGQEINNLLDKAKVKIKKMISLIKKWLLIIPGINKFFLEQEAKIKADKIMKLK